MIEQFRAKLKPVGNNEGKTVIVNRVVGQKRFVLACFSGKEIPADKIESLEKIIPNQIING